MFYLGVLFIAIPFLIVAVVSYRAIGFLATVGVFGVSIAMLAFLYVGVHLVGG